MKEPKRYLLNTNDKLAITEAIIINKYYKDKLEGLLFTNIQREPIYNKNVFFSKHKNPMISTMPILPWISTHIFNNILLSMFVSESSLSKYFTYDYINDQPDNVYGIPLDQYEEDIIISYINNITNKDLNTILNIMTELVLDIKKIYNLSPDYIYRINTTLSIDLVLEQHEHIAEYRYERAVAKAVAERNNNMVDKIILESSEYFVTKGV